MDLRIDHWYESGPELALSGKEILDVIDLLFAGPEARRELTFEDPRLRARIQRRLGIGEEEAARWNRHVHEQLWKWIGLGSDGGAREDPWTRLERELEL